MSDDKAIAKAEPLKQEISVSEGGIVLRTIGDLYRIAEGICQSGMAPKSLDTTGKIAVAILTGAEAGLSPMMSVRSIYVVNGAPAWLSKAARALVQNSGLLKEGTNIKEGVCHASDCDRNAAGKRCSDGCEGYCETWRKGDKSERQHLFSVADAKQAGLWGKKGPWQEYPTRMLMHRAAGFHFDDCWSDVLMGLNTVDVVADYPQAAFVRDGSTVATNAEPPGLDPLLAAVNPVVQDEGAGDVSVGEPTDTTRSGPDAPSCAPDAPEAPAPSEPDSDKPPDKVKCELCTRIFSRSQEAHWPYGDGTYRCAECGPRDA